MSNFQVEQRIDPIERLDGAIIISIIECLKIPNVMWL